MAGFSGLGLGYLGDEKKYIGEFGPSEMPGWLEGAIQVPKAYAAQHWLKPAVEWIENKMKPVAPPATSSVGVAPEEFRPDIQVSAPAEIDEAHASSNPWAFK